MKRMHLHVSVEDLSKSITFYNTLFVTSPTVEKSDYAKWMLNDPLVNFAISQRGAKVGLYHVGIQVENDEELADIKSRLDAIDPSLYRDYLGIMAINDFMYFSMEQMIEMMSQTGQGVAGKVELGDADEDEGGEEGESQPEFYVGSRGHHADIGGTTPGSMPPFSTSIQEEGVQINNVKLVAAGVLQEQTMLDLLSSGQYPSRNPSQNMADLRAQLAANEKGVQELRKMVDEFGLEVVQAYMRHVQDNAEESVRRVITRLKDGEFTLPLDNGAQIKVAVRVNAQSRSAEIDFTGTSAQQTNNFNAPTAVCMAAVLYVFRSLVNDDIPLNAGCLKPLKVIIPTGCMLNPNFPASVVAGNVETSSCITNALFGALGVMAGSQPTMNNFTFGNAKYQYYETISGGSGAGVLLDDAGHITSGFNGTSVVQTHMTNSRLTDPEILEFRFPVRLDSYALREGSGGHGKWSGGMGGVRRIRFLETMTASILSNGRIHPAFGVAGGQPGAPGINQVRRKDGSVEVLKHIGQVEMAPGDVFEIHTPGGGAYGTPEA